MIVREVMDGAKGWALRGALADAQEELATVNARRAELEHLPGELPDARISLA